VEGAVDELKKAKLAASPCHQCEQQKKAATTAAPVMASTTTHAPKSGARRCELPLVFAIFAAVCGLLTMM